MSKGTTSGLPTLPSCSAPACGQTLYGMVRFCPFCGTEQKVLSSAAVAPPAAAPKTAPAAVKPIAPAAAGAASTAPTQDVPKSGGKPGNQQDAGKQATPISDTAKTNADPQTETIRPRKGFAPDFIPNAPTQPAGPNLLQRIVRTIKRIVLGVVLLVVLVAGIGIWRAFQPRADANREKETAAQTAAQAEAAKQAEARDARDKAAAAAAAASSTRDAQQRARQDAQRQEAQRQEAQRQETLRQETQQREAIERDAQQTAQREAQREAQRQEAARDAARQQAADQTRQRAEANQESSVPAQRPRAVPAPTPAPVPSAPPRNVAPASDEAPTQRLARDLLRNAREQLRNKDYNAAISTANMARGYDPDNPEIAAIVRQANEEKQRALSNTTIN